MDPQSASRRFITNHRRVFFFCQPFVLPISIFPVFLIFCFFFVGFSFHLSLLGLDRFGSVWCHGRFSSALVATRTYNVEVSVDMHTENDIVNFLSKQKVSGGMSGANYTVSTKLFSISKVNFICSHSRRWQRQRRRRRRPLKFCIFFFVFFSPFYP